ncbi:MAG: bifunctional oligoribonuclease/PAP phosphatase NrnA [Desulfurivibrionaceae bacterium]|nr:bifunctional oligoribonuclease/PAP phosphatase NrnA [Desulfobulbales bacterium]MDT8334669.1 bifunctional oligoribonuclease/PAP phosphatase NrnA [Desulfurivibrionaceae bacterium]
MITVPNEILTTLQAARRVLVAAHIYPDGDALGSQLALGQCLESLGKEVFFYSEEEAGHLYDFLPGCEKLRHSLPADLAGFDCVVSVDCAEAQRMGKGAAQLLTAKRLIMIDHHAGHKHFGDLHWIDPGRASTGEMVYDLVAALGAEISYEAAYCLYTAVVSDTGSFMYSSTSADTFRVAAELVNRGVKPADVAGKLFENFTVNRLKLLKLVLDSLEIHGDSRIALITVTPEMFSETATVSADTENFINYPRSLASVRVAAFIKETRNSVVSVSLRSKGNDCDVAAVAAEFGGGGHRNAAGFKIVGGERATISRELLRKLKQLVANL